MSESTRNAEVLIIGGGLSGTMLAEQLLRLPGARHILVIEPRAELGRGEAYSAVELGHTLNGNAAGLASSAAPARRRSRPTAAPSTKRW